MNLIERYFKERKNIDTIYYEDKAFMMYAIIPEGCMIEEVYVLPEHREDKISHLLADYVADMCKEKGIKWLFCQSDERANGWEAAHKNILKYGFKEYDLEDTVHHYNKEVF